MVICFLTRICPPAPAGHPNPMPFSALTLIRVPSATLQAVLPSPATMWQLILVVGGLLAHQTRGDFINIDCGAMANSTSRDRNTTLVYTSDERYISTGLRASVISQAANQSHQLLTLRHFPASSTPRKNCFHIPVLPATVYLVRAWFYFGNYTNHTNPADAFIRFQLSVDSTVWTEVSIDTGMDDPVWTEAVVGTETFRTRMSVCLIRTDDSSTPFISALELRPQAKGTYVDHFQKPATVLLRTLARENFGARERGVLRFPQDYYDRMWHPVVASPGSNTRSIYAPRYPNQKIENNLASDLPPSRVMQSALTGPRISYSNGILAGVKRFYGYVYSCELNGSLPAGTKRRIDLTPNTVRPVDGQTYYLWNITESAKPFTSLPFGVYDYVIVEPNLTVLQFNLSRDKTSDYDPLINAFEFFEIRDVVPGTNVGDVSALTDLSSALGSNDEWSGDPCFPIPWTELECFKDRVTSLNISGKGYTGEIPASIGHLTSLEVLDLSNNHFNGSLPTWLANLTSLQTLDVSNNELNGTFPASYITDISPPGLTSGFRYSGNPDLRCVEQDNALCSASPPPLTSPTDWVLPSSTSRSGSSSSVAIFIGCAAGVTLVLFFIGGLVTWWWRSQRSESQPILKVHSITGFSTTTPTNQSGHPIRRQAQAYSLDAIKEATGDFANTVGEGRFGPVYYGIVQDEQEIAVKVLAAKARVAIQEVQHLSTVHYKHLVSLVGYSKQGKDLILLYEYMAGGDLKTHLHGPDQVPLTWRQRLQIACDAAKGLEYLHHGCSPPIIHGDVKSSNILLTPKLKAKVADFGLSKLFNERDTNVVAMERGTMAYLAPECTTSGLLTVKSDVFSFGVLMLETLCGQPPIAARGPTKFLVHRVRNAMSTGSLESVVDPTLLGEYNVEAVWGFAECAISCVAISAAARPSMTQVVHAITQTLETELATQEEQAWQLSGCSEPGSPVPPSLITTHYTSTTDSNIPPSYDPAPDEPSRIFYSQELPRAW